MNMPTNVLRIGVVGGGSWGTALAHVLSTAGHHVHMYVRDTAVVQAINVEHHNPRYLPGSSLCPRVRATQDIQALVGSEVILLAIPCQQARHFVREHAALLGMTKIIINAAKGIEIDTGCTVSQIFTQEFGGSDSRYAILSGPSFAAEVVQGQPTAVVLGCAEETVGKFLREVLSTKVFRCYSSTDVIGVELGGALKNIMAIAAGVCDGLGFGHNARAALITRGLAELSRIGVQAGGQARTFMGLSGLGDLTLTCTGDLSRNRQVGLRLGKGESLTHIVASLGMVAEGVKTTQAAYMLARQHQVYAPLTTSMYRILYENVHPYAQVMELMGGELKEE